MSVSNEQLYGVLLDIKGDIGRVQAAAESNADKIKEHIEADTRRFTSLYDDLGELKTSHARQRGFIGGLTAAGTALGAAIGYLIEKMTFGQH